MPPDWLVVGPGTPAADLPTGANSFGPLLDAEPVAEPTPVDPDSPAIIAFTSGTTRDPKGVIHSHRTIGFEARQLSSLNPNAPASITGAPLGHFIGLLQSLLCSLYLDKAVHLVDVWDPGEVLRLMLAEGVGMGGGSTYFLTSLLDHPDFTDAHLKNMPSCGLGGASVPLAVTERATNLGIEVYRSYGSTELPSATGCFIDEPQIKRMTTDGHALLGVDLRLDEDNQILLRGPELFLGYTDAALTAQVVDADGWYHSGDVGALDDDGYLSITDRISDVIIRGGENINTVEVEAQLLEAQLRRRGERRGDTRRPPRRAGGGRCAHPRRHGGADARGREGPPGRGRAWPSRSGPEACSSRSRTSRGRRRARSRSSSCASSSATGSSDVACSTSPHQRSLLCR